MQDFALLLICLMYLEHVKFMHQVKTYLAINPFLISDSDFSGLTLQIHAKNPSLQLMSLHVGRGIITTGSSLTVSSQRAASDGWMSAVLEPSGLLR